MTIFLGITWVAVLAVSYFAAVALLKKLQLY
jgi:hypothetical protein